jgi:hypothetical protein
MATNLAKSLRVARAWPSAMLAGTEAAARVIWATIGAQEFKTLGHKLSSPLALVLVSVNLFPVTCNPANRERYCAREMSGANSPVRSACPSKVSASWPCTRILTLFTAGTLAAREFTME